MVTIVICYQDGTGPMLLANLASIERHTGGVPYQVMLVCRKGSTDNKSFLSDLHIHYPLKVVEVDISSEVTSHIHGMMLDTVIPKNIETEYVLTLDSDCFPVANGWLNDMFDMVNNGARIVGILHPWAPPPTDMNRKKIEWRVRSQHCWETTHVACQMLKVSDLIELGVKYNAGDDTGLAIVTAAKNKGWKVDGFKVSRCPLPATGAINPEFNRYVCLVFGDKVYHHGGFTRITACNDKPVFKDEFGWVEQRLLLERGVEFLMDDSTSYRFKLDREEEVAKEKMNRLFGFRS